MRKIEISKILLLKYFHRIKFAKQLNQYCKENNIHITVSSPETSYYTLSVKCKNSRSINAVKQFAFRSNLCIEVSPNPFDSKVIDIFFKPTFK